MFWQQCILGKWGALNRVERVLNGAELLGRVDLKGGLLGVGLINRGLFDGGGGLITGLNIFVLIERIRVFIIQEK